MTSRRFLHITLMVSLVLIAFLGWRLLAARSEIKALEAEETDVAVTAPAEKKVEIAPARRVETAIRQPERAGRFETEMDTVSEFSEETDPEPEEVGDVLPEKSEKDLIRELLLGRRSNRWKRLKELGLEIENEDFEAVIEDIGEGRRNSFQMRMVLREWVNFDPEAAAKWVFDSTSGNTYTQAIRQVVSSWARKDPDAVANWLTDLDEGKDEAIKQYLAHIAYRSPAMAKEWYSRIEDEKVRLSTASILAGALARKDIGDAIDFVDGLPAGKDRDRAVSRIVPVIAKEDASIAFEWAETIQDENVRQGSITYIVGRWASSEPAEAGAYVNSLPDGSLKDNCSRVYAMRIAKTAPSTAMQWAQSIEDNRIKTGAIRWVAHQWKQNDSESLKDWVNGSDLDNSVKEQILTGRWVEGSSNQ